MSGLTPEREAYIRKQHRFAFIDGGMRDLLAEIDRLRAEIDRLRILAEERAHIRDEYEAVANRLRAEVERLAEALRHSSPHKDWGYEREVALRQHEERGT